MEAATFDSHDMAEVEAFVSNLYSRMRVGAAGERTYTHITRRVMTPKVAFDDLDFSFDLAFDAEPLRYLVLGDVISNTVQLVGKTGQPTFGAGDLFLVCQLDRPYTGVVHSARLRQLTLDPAVLSQVASSTATETEPVRLLDHRPVSRQAAFALRRSIAYVRDSVLTAPPELQSDLMVSAASQYLAARVLSTFPNTAVCTPTPGDRRDANPSTLRRATSFIEANPDMDLTLADIARAAHVAPRTLQLAFRRHLDTTPMAYLRRVRLDHAHADLQAATPGDGTTVSAVGTRWGFSGLSRFAADYRAAYGRHPHQSLRE